MPATRVTLSELRDLHRQALRLDRRVGGAVASLFPGLRRSRIRGRGVEFDEVRAYQWGDDFRAIDWRVTARTGEMHTRLFHEERERTLWLVCDAGPSMQFGTRGCFKWVQAARTAALFAWLAHDGGDRVGALIHGRGRHCVTVPAAGGDAGLERLFHRLAAVTPEAVETAPAGEGLQEALLRLRRLVRPGSLVLLLGDFLRPPENLEGELLHLRRHGELAAIRFHDPLEQALPRRGPLPVADGAGCSFWLESGDPALRRRWRRRARERFEALRRRFGRAGVPLYRVATNDPLVAALEARLR